MYDINIWYLVARYEREGLITVCDADKQACYSAGRDE